MQISYNWLKQFIKIDWKPEKTGELLTDLGLEVEGITTFESVKGGLKGIVVGHVLACEKHPNADRLNLTTVNIGEGDAVQIVCGAPNVAVGQKVPVATVGTVLYDSNDEPWKIKKGKIRGEVSHGMICAEDELGLGENHEGIMILEDDLEPGTPLSKVFKIETDHIFEIGLTPNRSDAMSHMGVARDLKAGLLQHEINVPFHTPSTSAFRVENRTKRIKVDQVDLDRAPRYCGVSISGLDVKESPDWLKNRLRSIGLAPKNNVVDVTNYVMHELGQPLHAFNLAKIAGEEIQVKTVKAGTKFTTLDDVERTLHDEDLMICDAEKPLCIAGVYGGKNSGVTTDTESIFLESAFFDSVSIRKTAKRHGLSTDASFRFERGIDPNITEYALMRAALLIQELAGGQVVSEIVDVYPKKIDNHQVFLYFDRAFKLIGEEIPEETIKSILSSLDIKINNITEAGIGMTIPAYRNDVTREVDVIEEILRVYGYNNIAGKTKFNTSIAVDSKFEDHRIQQVIGELLVSNGFLEILNNSLTNPAYAEINEAFNKEFSVEILNPLSGELSAMRQSLLFSGLESIAHNVNRKQENLKLFEFGKTYHNFPRGREEHKHLMILATGNRHPENWMGKEEAVGFYFIKSIVDLILERLGLNSTSSIPVQNGLFSEAIAYEASKKDLVKMGLVNKKVLSAFEIEQEVIYADFDWDALVALIKGQHIKFQPIPKYPEVRRDFALLLDHSVSFKQVYDTAKASERKLLRNINLFDVYTSGNLPEGKKSYAVSFTLLDEKKTLTDKQIDGTMAKIQNRLEKDLGAQLR
ncbi:MAG: phenylalanine--tRNA ligase subunit beta [Leeuwenhoekiella sp.]